MVERNKFIKISTIVMHSDKTELLTRMSSNSIGVEGVVRAIRKEAGSVGEVEFIGISSN